MKTAGLEFYTPNIEQPNKTFFGENMHIKSKFWSHYSLISMILCLSYHSTFSQLL